MRYACTVTEVRAGGGVRPVVLGAREVLVVGTDEGIRAVDRACPHEGYRLDGGQIRGQELTCPAHGWRFDLRSGACVTAGEDLRTYDVEVRDGAIFVDVDVEPTAQELALASEAVLGALETGRGSLAARGFSLYHPKLAGNEIEVLTEQATDMLSTMARARIAILGQAVADAKSLVTGSAIQVRCLECPVSAVPAKSQSLTQIFIAWITR